MTRNVLLTSLGTQVKDAEVRHYCVRNEYDREYCTAVQAMEASAKCILARHPIDEILIICDRDSHADDAMRPWRLSEMPERRSDDQVPPTALDLYRTQLARYIDEAGPEGEASGPAPTAEEREALAAFVADFLAARSGRLNRLFDELAGDRKLYEGFLEELLGSARLAGRDSRTITRWARDYLYEHLRPSAKLAVLTANEDVCARCIPSDILERRESWVEGILNIDQDVLDGRDEINLYVSLGNDGAVDAHVLLNMLDIIIATPGSNVRLRRYYTVTEATGALTGVVEDMTAAARTTDLVSAAHAFLDFGKTDMLVDFWEASGERDELIDRIVYATRHVDVGISMCNVPEVQEGIDLLRTLLSVEAPWTEHGDFGLLFGIICGCIRADLEPLIAGEGAVSFIELIKWGYRHQLYQQVLTLIEALAPRELVGAGIFCYCDDEERKAEVTRLFALQRLELQPYELYKMDDIDHYFVKVYDRASVRLSAPRNEDRTRAYADLRAASIGNTDPQKIGGHTACEHVDTARDVLYAYYHLGDVRNKISHADADSMAELRLMVSERDVSSAMLLMRESIEYFITCFEKAMAETSGKTPKVVLITADDVRGAASDIKHEQRSNRDDQNGSPSSRRRH